MKNSKFQNPSSKEISNTKLQTGVRGFEDWSLRFLWSLDFGTWSFLPC